MKGSKFQAYEAQDKSKSESQLTSFKQYTHLYFHNELKFHISGLKHASVIMM